MVLGVVEKGWDKRGQSERASEKGVSLFEEDVLMSSDEDVPAPSPSAAVLARRASREKPKRRVWLRSRDARATRIRFQISATNRHACKDWPHSHFRLPSCVYMAVTRGASSYIVAARPRRPIPSWPYHLHGASAPLTLPTPTHTRPFALIYASAERAKPQRSSCWC